MAEVTMTAEEYLELIDQSRNRKRTAPPGTTYKASVKRKKPGKKDPKMAKALRKANAMGRKKSGGFKKGWSQGKIMKKAHQLRRKMR
jgi:hypothetical protein